MPLSNEKIAEIQTIAKFLGNTAPSPDQINKTYDSYLLALNDPQAYEAQQKAEFDDSMEVWKSLNR
jgi:hypothetical protein